MMKNWSLMVLIFLVLISLALIIYPEFTRSVGVTVTSVDADSPCKDIITVGSKITGVGGKIVKDSNEFTELTKSLEGVVTFMINKNPRSCNIPEGSQLGVDVTGVKKSGIKLGTDLWGGIYYLFETEGPSQDLMGIMKQRSERYDFSDTKIELHNDTFIKIITGSDEEGHVNLLTERGELEGSVIETIDFNKESVEFVFNDKFYEMSLKDKKSVMINGSEYETGDNFELDGVDFVVDSISKNTTILSVKIFDDNDLTLIQDPGIGSSRIARQGSGYVFAIPVELSDESGENYEKVTKNLEVLVDPGSGTSYSKYPISIFIDDEEFITIPMLSEEMGEKRDNFVLWSYSPDIEKATESMVRLKTIIETKSLSQKLTLVERETFEAGYGESLITSLLFIVLIASVITIMLFFIKFRESGIASLPLILMILSEIVLIFGMLSMNWFAVIIFCAGIGVILIKGGSRGWKGWIGIFLFFVLTLGMTISKWSGQWTLDAPFVIGLITVVMISFGQSVFMGIRILTKKESYISSGYKKTSNKLWLSSSVFAGVLIILYFMFNLIGFMYDGFIMVLSIGLWINLSLILPVYTDIVKKFIK